MELWQLKTFFPPFCSPENFNEKSDAELCGKPKGSQTYCWDQLTPNIKDGHGEFCVGSKSFWIKQHKHWLLHSHTKL